MYKTTQHRAIYINSVNREKSDISRPDDFQIKFTPVLELSDNMDHFIAVDSCSLTYSWHNVEAKFKNDTLRYSHDRGVTWTKITIPKGMYAYHDLNEFIRQSIKADGNNPDNINLMFVISSYLVVIELKNDYQLDLSISDFNKLIGFDKGIITSTAYGVRLPDITRSVDALFIHSDCIVDSLVDGQSSDTMMAIPISDLIRGFSFIKHPHISHLYNPVSSTILSRIRFYLTDVLRRPIDLNGIEWSIVIILKSVPK